MFFAILIDTNTHKTQFKYIGPFESEKECEKMCQEQNEKRGYHNSVRFVVQKFSEGV